MDGKRVPAWSVYAVVLACLALGAALTASVDLEALRTQPAAPRTGWELKLPVNRWIEMPVTLGPAPSFRWSHSGSVYDQSRDSLILFGADEHLVSFDNAIYELRLRDLKWIGHQPPSPPYAMRTDAKGRRVAGLQQLQPWPMHIYDAMIYDPSADSVMVFSGAKHSFVPAPGAQTDPAWTYALENRQWRMAPELQDGLPNFFAAGAVYDPLRNTVIAYSSTAVATPFVRLGGEDELPRIGVWELGPDRREWQLATSETHHWGWFNAEFDSRHGVMLVFGRPLGAGDVWVYKPGSVPGQRGEWQRRSPGGDLCPAGGGYYFPAAYDSSRGMTLVLPPDVAGWRNITCLYDYGRDRWLRIEGADLPPLEINYTLVYSPKLDVFVLVSGSFFESEPTRVWALRLGR